jgi:copper chaperone CopZ
MSIVTARLSTTGMHCSSCSTLVDMTLDDLEGETVVTYESDTIGIDAIIEAIRGAGYDATPAA